MPPKKRCLTPREPRPFDSANAADQIDDPVAYLHDQIHCAAPDYRVQIHGTAELLQLYIVHRPSKSTSRWQWTYASNVVADEEEAAYRQALMLLFEDGIIPPYTHQLATA